MKRIKNPYGWSEVTTKEITVTLKHGRALNTAGSWVIFCQNRPAFNKGGRNHCDRCGKKWADCKPDDPTFFCHTNKGNKIVCEQCFNDLEVKRV